MSTFVRPDGNRESWIRKPEGYFTPEEWEKLHPVEEKAPGDCRSAVEKRQDAYRFEADPFFHEAQFYQVEAEGLEAAGDFDKAAIAKAKAMELKKAYALKKAEIRARFPEDGAERYRLASSGTYHQQDCGYASESAELVTLAEIRAKGSSKPCSRCKPPEAIKDNSDESE